MAFVGSLAAGLELLARQPFDVVVAVGWDDFLTEVGRLQPQAVKIALSDETHRNLFSQPLAHRYLSKACDAETLGATLERACGLRDLLSDGALRQLVSQMQSLPSLPALYLEVMDELRSPNSSIKTVNKIIERDLGMTAKILQTVNSASYGIRQRISSPAQAVNLLGLDMVAALVLTIQVFSKAQEGQLPGFSPAALWDQALQVGEFAKLIAQAERQPPDLIQDSITAGLLHDAGKLVLAANQPQRYARVLSLIHDVGLSPNEAELEVFGTLHSAVGAYLLWLWGLPDPVVEAVAFHIRPWSSPSRSFSPLTAVHAAKILADKGRPQERGLHAVWLDLDYLTRLRLIDRLPVWRKVCARAVVEAA
jgi:HD-like signal output (HDOD) protein